MGMITGEIALAPNELHLENTLINGQAFRWSSGADGWWHCVLAHRSPGKPSLDVPVCLCLSSSTLFYQGTDVCTLSLIRDYFRLDLDLNKLALEFKTCDPYLSSAVARFPGLRLLRQDPVENLFSFLCTAAAPLHRIRRNIAGLCRRYGVAVPNLRDGCSYSFPTVEALAEASVPEMVQIGLGYRAKFIHAAANQVVVNGGAEWLLGLRTASYAEAKAALITLPGVGEKIADCVCLFSLDKDAALPIDTHIRRIAGRDYGIDAAAQTLTPAAYALIGDGLRSRFGAYAGWAQQYLFFQELYGRGAWEAYVALWREEGL